MLKYKINGTSYDGFLINNICDTKEEAMIICKEAKLNPQLCITAINGNIKGFTCVFCGFYYAEKPKCNMCEVEV